MNVGELLKKVDTLKPNRFTRPQKLEWLAQIEGQIYEEIVCTHDNPMRIRKPHIDQNTEPEHKLIAPFPYDEVYVLWVECQIDLGNMEITKYNNDRTLFNNALMTLRDYWNRTFMPCERAHCFAFTEGGTHSVQGMYGHGGHCGHMRPLPQESPLDIGEDGSR